MKNILFRTTVTIASFILLMVYPAMASDWIKAQKNDSVAYFFVSSPPSVQRYDLENQQWLPSVELPAARGALIAGTIDDDGLYIAYDKSTYRYAADGSNEQFIISASSTVQSLHTDGDLLLINHSSGLYSRLISVDKNTNQTIATFSDYIESLYGASEAPSINRLFGSRSGISPDDVVYVEYNDDGTFVTAQDSPYHGDYPSSSKTWVFPNEGRFVDDSGTIYSTSDLTYAGSFPSNIDDITFHGVDIPIVLEGNTITAYTNTFLPTGSVVLANEPNAIFTQGSDVFAFRHTHSADPIAVESIPLSNLSTSTPGQPVDPSGLPYSPDDLLVDTNGVVYLLSKGHQNIFRWDPATQSYLQSISLIGTPKFFAYSADNHSLYLAYDSGLIYSIDLSTSNLVEVAFAVLPSSPLGLSTAGEFVFSVDGSGAWNTHYTFDPSGTLISSIDWNYYSRAYVWNEARQKMYFFRDDTSPNDLLWEEINANGTAYPTIEPGGIGLKQDSPLHTSTGFQHPIRIAPDGSVVVLGSGLIHDAETLTRLTPALSNPITDATWSGGTLFSVHTISGSSQYQRWTSAYGLSLAETYPGEAYRLATIPNDKLVGVNIAADGIPSFYVFDDNFSVVAPPNLEAPEALDVQIINTSRIDLSWQDVSGEKSYRIERESNNSGIWQQVGTTATSATSFSDVSVVLENTYAYRVTALNDSLQSAPGTSVPVHFRVPEIPTLTATTISASKIRLSWTNADLETGYTLQRSSGNSGSWTTVATLDADVVTHLNSNLESNTEYHYRISAANGIGDSAYSAMATATTLNQPPTTPYYFSTSTSIGLVSLTWSNVNSEDGYRVERRLHSATDWTSITTTGPNISRYDDRETIPQTTYVYRIIAYNSAGESSPTSEQTVTTPPLPIPSAPLNTDALPDDINVLITWSDSIHEESYLIMRRIGEASWEQVAQLPADTVSFTDTSVILNTYYNYQVVAINSSGQNTSSEVSVLAAKTGAVLEDDFDSDIDYSVWSILSGAKVQSGSIGFFSGKALHFGENGLRLATTVSSDLIQGGTLKFQFRAGNQDTDGIDLWNNSEAEEGVIIEYSVNGGVTWNLLQLIETEYPNNSSWNSYSITIPIEARSTETSFRWRQRAHSGAGTDQWALDNVQVIGVALPPPSAPPFISASANSSDTVAISWVGTGTARSYIIERRTPSTDWVVVANTPSYQTYYTDNSATPLTSYSYRVSGANSGGVSPASQTAFVTTWSLLQEWRFQNYSVLDNIGAAADMEENNTGIPNLLKYAFNMAANDYYHEVQENNGTKGMPFIRLKSQQDRKLQIAFIRRRASSNPGISYSVEFSSNLKTWNAVGSEILATPINEDFEYVVWEDSNETSSNRLRFVQIRVIPEE